MDSTYRSVCGCCSGDCSRCRLAFVVLVHNARHFFAVHTKVLLKIARLAKAFATEVAYVGAFT